MLKINVTGLSEVELAKQVIGSCQIYIDPNLTYLIIVLKYCNPNSTRKNNQVTQ